MLIAVLAGIAAAMVWGASGGAWRRLLGVAATLVPLTLFVYFLSLVPGVAAGGGYLVTYPWVPSLGVSLSFRVDGLSLLFALLITGIGTLVFAYTLGYMGGYKYLHRFYAYLSLFMAAMLGLVLSDNLIVLFIFWELTSISSFFLIGFKNEEAASRKSALTALGITGFGGLLLLAGAILLGQMAGTYSLQEMREAGFQPAGMAGFGWLLFFMLGAAFTKSAQFPLHFWLPGAMRAPTPVSTYLHSATMVKAGVYLLLRTTPLFTGNDSWHAILTTVGAITMVYAAVQTLFRSDLKSILAYSTISALGILVFLTGLGTPAALQAAVTFILVHALYKATLFLVTGIIDYSTGTRNIHELRGLAPLMMPVAAAGLLAALSNAGLPPFFGFIGKDLIYEATWHFPGSAMLWTVAAIVTNVCLMAAGLLAGLRPFAGKRPEAMSDFKAPGWLLWVPPLLLAVLGLLFGLVPGWADMPLLRPAAQALGVAAGDLPKLKLWHGFNTILLLSAVTLVGGAVMYIWGKPTPAREDWLRHVHAISPPELFDRFGKGWLRASAWLTGLTQNGQLRKYIRNILLLLGGFIIYELVNDIQWQFDRQALLELTVYEVAMLILLVVAVALTISTSSRLTAVVAMGVVGYSICLLFVFYSAPDLAMTQFTIDTLTVILFVLVLYRLPRYLDLSDRWRKTRDAALALGLGTLITLLALTVLQYRVPGEVAQYYAENAYVKAKGKNVVNVILVDFRGLDTMVEITVLAIAAIGVFGLLKLRIRDEEE